MRLRPLAVSIVGVLLMAGCGSSGDKPTASPTATVASGSPTHTPTPSPSRTGPLTSGPNVKPGETPPVFPAAAKQHTSAGALAFAVYFIKALDWSLATTDPFLLDEVSAPTCGSCTNHVDAIRTLERKGGHVEGGRIVVTSAAMVDRVFKLKSDFVVRVDAQQGQLVLVQADGSRGQPTHAKRDSSYIFVSWIKDRWRVIEQSVV